MTDDLHRGTFMADLLLHALESNLDKPCVYLGDQVLTAREVRDEMSRYSQALAGLGLGKGSPMSVLAPNRPEVLFNMGANNFVGCRTTPLHPLGSEDDHAYVIDDAGIETLVYDPLFEERAIALRDRCPGLLRLLCFGPTEHGDDYIALAAKYEPAKLRRRRRCRR